MALDFSFFVKNKIQKLKVLKSTSNEIQKNLNELNRLTDLETELLKLKKLQSDHDYGFMYDKDADIVEDEIYTLKFKLNIFLENPGKIEIKKQELSGVEGKINTLKKEITQTIMDRIEYLQNHDKKNTPQAIFTP